MYERLMEQIDGHASYSANLKEAAGRDAWLILNYHTHGNGMPYCVAICEPPVGVLPILGQQLPLQELVHVRGFGDTREECYPRCLPLGQVLQERFGFTRTPRIYLDGQPAPPPEEMGGLPPDSAAGGPPA